MEVDNIEKQITELSKKYINMYFKPGSKLRNMIETFIYCHENGMLDESTKGDKFTFEYVILGLNTLEAVKMSHECLNEIIRLQLEHADIKQTINDAKDELKSNPSIELLNTISKKVKALEPIEGTLEGWFRRFFGFVERFTKT